MNSKNPILRNSRVPRGFTLTELLVVILIIATLAALTLPVIRNMKATANKTECVNRLRSWGVAFAGYAADNDGKIEFRKWYPISWDPAGASPYVAYWSSGSVDFDGRDDQGAYETQMRMRCCPSVKWDRAKGNSPVCYSMIRPTSNGALVPNQTEYSLAKIKNPARFMLMSESRTGNLSNLSSSGDFNTNVKPLGQDDAQMRHKGAINVLLANYSVQSMTWAEIEKGLSYWSAL